MTAANVHLHTKEGCVHIAISGEIDLANAADLEEHILPAVSNQATAMSIDLTDLTYMDSTALQILFRVAERAEDLQIPLDLVAPPDSNARLMIVYSGLESLARLRSHKATEL
jgi:anti-anti-sigma factor